MVRVFSDDNRIDNIDNQYKKLAGVSCTDKSGLDFPPPSPPQKKLYNRFCVDQKHDD